MFRVMTLNLNYDGARHGSWPERRALVAAQIRRFNPHLVALQAVWRPARADNQAEELAHELPGHVHVWFEPAMEEPSGAAKGNQTPEHELRARLREAGWVDAWPWLRGAEPGLTYEAGQLQSRIDYAYANSRLSGRLAEIDTVGEEYTSVPRLSDHLGLVATLTLG